jgi:3-oxoacyl-[acyl-carrier protein] reductase
LGLALARDLARDHDVLGFARSEPPPGQGKGFRHLAGIDMEDLDALEPLRPELAKADGLVNNAAVAYDGLLATQSRESLERSVHLNLTATLYLTRLYVRERLAARRAANVVTIGSIVGFRGYAGLASYGATKAALSAMTRSLAREMGSKGFRFNTVLPGYFASELSQGLGERQLQQIVRRTPLGRLAEVGDVVPVVRFLLSADSGFVTGQEIVVDGGLTI